MAEIGWCGGLSLGKNLGQPQNNFNHLLWGCFWSFRVLEGATGVTKMRCSLPECEWDRMYSHIGHRQEFKAVAKCFNHFLKALREMPPILGVFLDILRLWWEHLRLRICSVASLYVDEIELSCRLGLVKNLGPMRHDFKIAQQPWFWPPFLNKSS